MLDVWTYLRLKSEKSSTFHGPAYYLTLALSILGVFGLFLLGSSQMYLRISSLQGRILVSAVFPGWLLALIVGFGWMEVWERFKDPYQFLARYCAVIQTLFLMLTLNSIIAYGGRLVALYELVLFSPSDSIWIHLYITTSAILCLVYLTPIGRNRWVKRLSGIVPPLNIALLFANGIHFDNKWTPYGLGTMILSVMLSLLGLFPQLYWALNPRSKDSTKSDLDAPRSSLDQPC